jgi:peptidase C39-like protein
MQAVRADRKRLPDARWLQHLSLLSAVGFLFSWVVAARPQAAVQLVEGLPVHFLAPPSTPAQEWRPIRVPVRTSRPPDPSPPPLQVTGLPTLEAPIVGGHWVQAHRRTALLATPEDGAAREFELPQWSYLRILESRPDWLRVSYGSDGNGQPDRVAWVPAADVGLSGPPPRFVTSTRQTPLWSADGPEAEPLTLVPRLATLELAGAERNGRVAVRVAESAETLAWVDWEAVTGSVGPSERDVPLERAFSPLVGSVRLDVPWRTQLDGSLASGANCGPTSVSMVLQSFGIYIPTSQARALATRFMGISSPFSGTSLESLRHVAETYGLEGLDLYENGRYKRWTLEDIRRHLRAGHPVIPQLRYRLMPGREWTWVGYDHYVVLTGVDGDDFLINDPATLSSAQGQSRLTAAQLLRAWMNSDAPGAGLAIARPL